MQKDDGETMMVTAKRKNGRAVGRATGRWEDG